MIDAGAAQRSDAACRERCRCLLRAAKSDCGRTLSITSGHQRLFLPVSGFLELNDFRENWTIGATVDLPILTGGRLRGSEMVARADLEESRQQLQQTRELAQLGVSSALAELTASRAALDASTGTVEQAARAYRIAEVRFQAGVSTQLELSDARLQLQQAEANRAQAARDLQVARARIALLPDLPIGAAVAEVQQQRVAAPIRPATATGTNVPAVRSGRPGGGNQ